MCQQEVDPESIEPGRYYIDKIYPTTGCRGILYKLFGIGGDEYKLIKVEEVIDKNIVIGTVKGVAFKDSETGKWTEIPIEWGNHHLFAVPDEPDETCCCANGLDR